MPTYPRCNELSSMHGPETRKRASLSRPLLGCGTEQPSGLLRPSHRLLSADNEHSPRIAGPRETRHLLFDPRKQLILVVATSTYAPKSYPDLRGRIGCLVAQCGN